MMQLVALWLWGTIVGLDLISVGQFMVARPLVAGTVAGVILGDPVAGGMVGAVLELFALDVLPVGAVRYPDYGVGAVAAALTAANAPHVLALGLAVAVGLVVAYLGELGISVVRSATTNDVRRHEHALDAGDWGAILSVHRRGLGRDLARAAVVTAAGLMIATVFTRFNFVNVRGAILVSVVVVGAGMGTAAAGAMRLGGRGFGLKWFVLGLVGGTVAVLV